MKDPQTQDELAIFGRFLAARGLQIDPSRYSKRPTPEPDILFTDQTNEVVAFELVEILDQNWARVLNTTHTLNKALRAAFEALPESDNTDFVRKFSNADVGFHFKPGVPQNKRIHSLPKILARLRTLPKGYAGPAIDEDPTSTTSFTTCIYIGPPQFRGRIFTPAT